MSEETKSKKVEFSSIETILNNPSDLSKLKNYLDESVNCKERQKMESEALKDIKEVAKETLNIDPKLFNQLVKVAYDHSYLELRQELSNLDTAIELLFCSDKED
jgi:hypothetical protein